MALIAKQRQVLCITHLAQIACFADQHLYIAKNSDQGMTASEVTILSRAGRIEEIMRMTSGTNRQNLHGKMPRNCLLWRKRKSSILEIDACDDSG